MCQRLKILTVTDEFTRESLAVAIEIRLQARGVIKVLERLMAARGAPVALRSDIGPEFVAQAVQGWVHARQVPSAYIAPGSPWQNGYGESFTGRFRDECLNLEWFDNLAQARVVIERWRRQYNKERPQSSLGYQTPRAFRAEYDRAQGSKAGRAERIWSIASHAVLTV